MRIHCVHLALAALIACAHPSVAAAQIISLDSHDGLRLGVAVGTSDPGGQNPLGDALDVSLSLDLAIDRTWRGRVDVGVLSPRYETYERGYPIGSERVRFSRLTVSAIRTTVPGAPVRTYSGLGLGVYRFDFREGPAVVTPGVHGLVGLEVAPPDSPLAIGAELSLSAARGPERRPVIAYFLFSLRASVGMTVRF